MTSTLEHAKEKLIRAACAFMDDKGVSAEVFREAIDEYRSAALEAEKRDVPSISQLARAAEPQAGETEVLRPVQLRDCSLVNVAGNWAHIRYMTKDRDDAIYDFVVPCAAIAPTDVKR